MIRIASADHGSGMPPGREIGAATPTSTRSPPPDSGNAATVCAPSPSEPGRRQIDRLLERRQIVARRRRPRSWPRPAAGGPSEIATAPPARSAIPDSRPTSRICVDTSTGHSDRPASATGHAATRQHLSRRQQQTGEARCACRASRTIVRASKLRGQPRRHDRRVLVARTARSRRPPRRNGSHHGSVSSRSRSVS